MVEVGKLYKSSKPQWHDGFCFQTVKVVKLEDGVVSFTTEWPVQALDCKVADFEKLFYRWWG
jgi:hypothetical protein